MKYAPRAFTKREMQGLNGSRAAAHGAMVLLVAAFLAYTSPYGAIVYLEFVPRWAYWSLTIGASWLINVLVFAFLSGRPAWLRILTSATLAAPVVFVIIFLIQGWIDRPVPAGAIPDLLLSIWVICVALAGIFALVTTALVAKVEDEESRVAAPEPVPPPLSEQLPFEYQESPIYALEADDHYVHVHTQAGKHLHYMRLRDAITLMSGVPGIKVHRSWWVALEGIREIKRENGRWRLDVQGAGDVPVSRSGLSELKKAQLIDS